MAAAAAARRAAGAEAARVGRGGARHTHFLCGSGTAAINFGRISGGRFLKISPSISL